MTTVGNPMIKILNTFIATTAVRLSLLKFDMSKQLNIYLQYKQK